MGFLAKLILGEIILKIDEKHEQKKKERDEVALYKEINSEEDCFKLTDDEYMILTTKELEEYQGKNYAEVYDTFTKCGFTNIQAIGMKDLFFSKKKKGVVEKVTINDTSIWGKDQFFPPDTLVVIKYHSPR